MKPIVVDASFILRALLSENSKAALAFQNIFKKQKASDLKIYAPSFLLLEVANGLRFSLKSKALVSEVFAKFLLLPIEYFDFKPEQLQEIITFAFEIKATVYDSAYHVLAKILGGEFYTCDFEYYNQAQGAKDIILN